MRKNGKVENKKNESTNWQKKANEEDGHRATGAGSGAAAMLAGMSCCRCPRCHHGSMLSGLPFCLCMQVCKLIKKNLILLICFA